MAVPMENTRQWKNQISLSIYKTEMIVVNTVLPIDYLETTEITLNQKQKQSPI